MGQQQLLLIMLSVIVVGIAVVIGITLFTASSTEHKRDILINESITLATMAQQYYRLPTAMGGGGRSFANWKIPATLVNSENGNFSVVTTTDSVVITGTGNEVLSNGDSIQVKVTANSSSIDLKVIH